MYVRQSIKIQVTSYYSESKQTLFYCKKDTSKSDAKFQQKKAHAIGNMNGIMIQLGWDKKDKKISHIHFVPFVRRGKSEKEREETCLPKENSKY